MATFEFNATDYGFDPSDFNTHAASQKAALVARNAKKKELKAEGHSVTVGSEKRLVGFSGIKASVYWLDSDAPEGTPTTDEPTPEARYKFNAITTDSHECHKCGKTELKKVVMVETVDADGNGTGDITPMGTTCAAKALGMNKKYKTPEAVEAAFTAKAESKAGYEKAIESAKKQAVDFNDHVAIVKVSGHYTAVREAALNANPNLYGMVYEWIAPTADKPTDVTPQPHEEMQVKSYNICTTDMWVFKTIEPSPRVDGMPGRLHSTIGFIESECWGDVVTRRAPDALQALPPMTDERSNAFRKWYQGLYQISLDAIFGKYPHLKGAEHKIRDGEVIVISETDPTTFSPSPIETPVKSIITGRFTTYRAYEPTDMNQGMSETHARTSRMDNGQWVGEISRRYLPDSIETLPDSERKPAVKAWQAMLDETAIGIIFEAHPELKDMPHKVSNGAVRVSHPTKSPLGYTASPAAVLDLIGAARSPEYGNDARRVKCESETQYQSILALDGQGVEIIHGDYPFIILQPVLADPDEIKVGDYIVNRQSPRYGGFVFKMCPIPTVNKNGKVVDGDSGYECRLDTGGKRWIPEAAAVKAEPPVEIQDVIDEAQMDANTYNHRITVYHEFHEYGYAYSGYAYRTTSEWDGMQKEWTVDNKACGRSFIVEILPKK